MASKQKMTIIAVGGSILVPDKIDTAYIKKLRNLIIEQINEGRRFILVAGGGSTARHYQKAATEVVNIEDEDKDWLGIHSTRLNAHLLRTIFYDIAYPAVLDNPEKPIKKRDLKRYALFVASGWRPGWSTDYIAFRLADRFNVEEVLIATRIPYIYEKDIDVHKNAKHFKDLSWEQYKKLLPKKEWEPGLRCPVDPVATDFASKNKISCVLLQGTDIDNLNNYFSNKEFIGTTIEG
ncbi:MAG: UMP kinase [Candidatus Spechtbacterales bacterium]|nr:UMP kinase [Candidatus Spechtbacterales bacterium]